MSLKGVSWVIGGLRRVFEGRSAHFSDRLDRPESCTLEIFNFDFKFCCFFFKFQAA